MEFPTVETLVRLAEQLSEAEQAELVRRIEALLPPRQRPSQTLRVFHVDHFPENLTLRREDEYGDDER
jgi:Ser/Thr protein kinase RdoA (MazF antagonist)